MWPSLIHVAFGLHPQMKVFLSLGPKPASLQASRVRSSCLITPQLAEPGHLDPVLTEQWKNITSVSDQGTEEKKGRDVGTCK